MGQFLKNIVLFTMLCLFGYVPVICLWGEIASQDLKTNVSFNIGGVGHLFTRLQEVKTTENVDVLVLGTSLAYRGFDPRVFESHQLRLFNLGSSAQTPLQTEILLHRYLDRLHPRIVIFEVNPFYLSNDGVESSLDFFANDKNDFASIRSAFIINNVKTYNALIYGVYKDITAFKLGFKEPTNKKDDTYISHGFVEKALSYNRNQSSGAISWTFERYQLAAFHNSLRMLKEKGISYVLVQAPISKARYANIINKEVFDTKMTNLGTYYNFNELMQLNDGLHFYDSHHLNQNGVAAFNNYLIKTLFLDYRIK
ncbi:hypothetical protein OE09_2111 [Flavobacteriaceae bacterium MAR_2010_72]|nr:hypothetical protein OE09_2111 [Flavobacteriaceae bacterium MAR_2010_72]